MLRDEVLGNNRYRHNHYTFSLHITLTTLAPKNHDLLTRPVYIESLFRTPRRLSPSQWTAMLIPPSAHLNDECLMPSI